MVDKDKIILKINKLLELSKNNKNLNEAENALLAAKEIMYRHDLSEANIKVIQSKENSIIDSIRDRNDSLVSGKVAEWQAYLANTISTNNNCRCYLTTIQNGEESQEAISLVGREKDVEFVKMLFAWLSIELMRLASEADVNNEELYKESFLFGAIKKIGIRFKEEEQRINEDFRRTTKFNKNFGEFAIQVVSNKIKHIDSYLNNLNLKNQNKEITNQLAFGKGYVKADSVDLMQNKKLA